MTAIRPTPQQLRFLDWEFGVFFHFGIRSFYPGHLDWDGQTMALSKFNPLQLDCEQWIRTIKQAGARYAVLTAKHHDGFALWPTAYSDYSVKNTPWRDGQGDVVRLFVDACQKHDISVGLYYSPAQWGAGPAFQEGSAYDDYFIAQVTELLCAYGHIDYLWFDGAGSSGHRYDKARIVAAIRALQPDILLFNLWDPDTLWAGNEDGYAGLDNHNVRRGLKAEQCLGELEQPESLRFLPLECDCKMRDSWFWDHNEDTLKSLPELIGMWELSVGRGANLLLNIGPDARGLLPEKDAKRLTALGDAIKERYGSLLPFDDAQSEHALCLHSPESQLVNRVMLQEDLSQGQHIQSFRLYGEINEGLSPVLLYQGLSLGHKALCVFPTVRVKKLSLVCEPPEAISHVTAMSAYLVNP